MLKRFRELLVKLKRPRGEIDPPLAWHQRYKEVFSTPNGELVLAHILKNNFVFDSDFTSNPQSDAHKEGRRYAALSIFRLIERDPKELIQHENTPES